MLGALVPTRALGLALAGEFDFLRAALVLGTAAADATDVHIPRVNAAFCRLRIALIRDVRDTHLLLSAGLAALLTDV